MPAAQPRPLVATATAVVRFLATVFKNPIALPLYVLCCMVLKSSPACAPDQAVRLRVLLKTVNKDPGLAEAARKNSVRELLKSRQLGIEADPSPPTSVRAMAIHPRTRLPPPPDARRSSTPRADCSPSVATRRSRPARWRGRLGSPRSLAPLLRWQARPVHHARRAARPADNRGDPRRHRPPRPRPHAIVRRFWLGWIDANREIWLATGGLEENLTDPELRAAVDAIRERVIDSLIAGYPTTLSDGPRMRLMLRSFLAFNRVVVRSWLSGEVGRPEAQRLLANTLHSLITAVAPRLKRPARSRYPRDPAETIPACPLPCMRSGTRVGHRRIPLVACAPRCRC